MERWTPNRFTTRAARTTREWNAANLTIYPIDARGVAVSSRAYINIGTMQELAEQTGGKAYYNSNDLASLVRSAFEDSRRGYVLSYAPSDLQDDGKYHGIRLRTTRHGVQLRYRPGYYADTQQAARPIAPNQLRDPPRLDIEIEITPAAWRRGLRNPGRDPALSAGGNYRRRARPVTHSPGSSPVHLPDPILDSLPCASFCPLRG